MPVPSAPARRGFVTPALIALLAWSATPRALVAQANWDVQLAVDPYPSPYLSDWETNPTISTLTVTNPTGQSRSVHLVYRVTDRAGQLLASGRSDAQALPPGATTYTSFVDMSGSSSHDANLEAQMKRTGRLPEGDYSVCVVATDAGGFVLAEACEQFAIVYPDPPLLIAPLDGEAVPTTQPVFQWTPLQVPIAYRVQYVLRVTEVLDRQTPDEALRANIPLYENLDVGAPNLSYPISARALEQGKTYAWRVQALDQYGYPPSANNGMSEVRTFRFAAPGVVAPPGSVMLSVTNLRGTTDTPSDTASRGVADICRAFDSTTVGVSKVHFGINSPVAFPANLNIRAGLHRFVTSEQERVWALVGRVPLATPLDVLVYGSCDDHAADWMPGAKWLAIRTAAGTAQSTWLLRADSAAADSASRIPGFEFGVVVFTLQENTIAAPAGFTAVEEFLQGREFDAKPGVNVLAVRQLEEGSAWDFFRWMGYDQKELTFYGFAGVNTALNFGFGRTRDGSFANASAELEFINLKLLFPEREPPGLLQPFFKAMHLELELAVKDTVLNLREASSSHQFHLVLGVNHRIQLTDAVTQALRLDPGATLVGTFSFDLSTEQKPASTELKMALKYALAATWTVGAFVIGPIEVEVGKMLYGANTGDVNLSVTGSVGLGDVEALGKLAVTVGRQPKPRFLSMLDGMRDNINRWQDRRVFTMGELVMAKTAADSAKLQGYIKQYDEWIATEQDQLTTFQSLNTTVELRKKALKNQPHCLGKAGWFCTFRFSFGNMSLVDMLALVRGVGGNSAVIRARLVLALVCAPVIAAAQDPLENFDLSSLQIPKGFLDLQEFEINGVPSGGLTATARTTLGGAAARVFLASETGADGKRILTLALRPENWSLTKAIPALANPVLDNLTLSNVTLVITGSDVRLPAALLPDDQYLFYREVYQADDFTLVLKPGINLIAAIPVDRLEPGHPLLGVMDVLGIEKGTVLLQGALGGNLAFLGGGGSGGGGGGLKDLFLRAELPPMRPPGSPEWFKSGQLALELTGLPSVRLVGEMNVAIKEDELRFFLAASLASSGLSLTGGMVADEPWVAPFGIDWLTLNKVVLQIGFTSTGAVQLGFAGDAVFGEKDIDVAVAVAITPPGVPTNFIVKGESEAGVGLSDVAMVQQKMVAARGAVAEAAGTEAPKPLIDVAALPNIEFRDLGLQFAPMAAPDLGVEQGMKLKGRMWLPLGAGGALTDFAGVDINVSRDGFWARGDLKAFKLGPLTWDDAAIDLTAVPGNQHFMVKGDVLLFGARQKVDVSISRAGLEFHTLSELFGLFRAQIDATAAFNLRNPAFQVDAVVDNSFGQYVQPILREGVERFARGSATVVNALSTTVTALDAALSKADATADELRRTLVAMRANAERNNATARAAAEQARASANAAKRSQDGAYNLWYNTPYREVALKAQRRLEWVRWTGIYAARSAAYASLNAAAEVQRRILDALPPVDRNVMLMAADAAVAALRGHLQNAQRELTAMRDRVDTIIAFVESGVDLFTVERAEIHAGLDGLLRGDAVNWKVMGTFVGQPYTLERTLNFTEPARAIADMVTGLLGA